VDSSQDGDSYGIFAQRYDSGGLAQGDEFRVNSYTTRPQYDPAVALAADGEFLVTWMSSQQDGSSWGVFGQRYDGAGVPLAAEFQVNSFTTDTQRNAWLAATGASQFVVVWNSFTQDGSRYGVVGQRLSFAPDFTPSCNPATLTIAQGSGAGSTCTVGSLNAFNDAVTLSCLGLPNGASCSFSPNPVTPPPDGSVNSTLTVSVANGTPLGSYPFQVQGVSGPLLHTFDMTLNVTAPELIVNGGFELSRAPWVLAGPGALYLANGPLPHAGTGYAQLGGGNNRVGSVYQQVAIPSSAPANLTFWLNVTSLETSSTRRNDTLGVEVRSKSGVLLATLGTFSNLDKTAPGNYSQKAFSMAAFRGQTVRLVFRVATNPSLPTTFRVDDVSLQ
jgi:hypothetical protein